MDQAVQGSVVGGVAGHSADCRFCGCCANDPCARCRALYGDCVMRQTVAGNHCGAEDCDRQALAEVRNGGNAIALTRHSLVKQISAAHLRAKMRRREENAKRRRRAKRKAA